MKKPIKLLLLAVLLYSGALFAATDNTAANTVSLSPTSSSLLQEACPASSGQRIDTAQVSQSDCCKGHKGVCGCRAGKIVCCDNTASTNCTCHSDWGVAN
ncbi:MAG: hypothetical protein Q8O33_03895 [Pseudomonadota bacterium]|nr:hypothetical protein [Pseudomonadota bacterium]